MRRSMFVAMSLSLVWSFYSFDVAAQSEVEMGVAREMYNHGYAAFERHDYAVCVGDMAASYRMVPKPMALFYLAKCEDLTGKIASAEAHFSQFLAKVSELSVGKQMEHRDKINEAENAREKLRPNIPSLTLILSVLAPKSVQVTRDGKVLPLEAIGVAIPLDPGEHIVTTQVPGGLLGTHRFIVQPKEKKLLKLRIDVPSLLPSTAPPKEVSVQEVFQSLRTPGFVAFGVASAAFVTWGVAGVIAMKEKSTVDEVCPPDSCVIPDKQTQGREAWNRGTTAAEFASVGLGLGITGSVLATAMLVMSSRPVTQALPKSSLVVERSSTGTFVGLRGVF